MPFCRVNTDGLTPNSFSLADDIFQPHFSYPLNRAPPISAEGMMTSDRNKAVSHAQDQHTRPQPCLAQPFRAVPGECLGVKESDEQAEGDLQRVRKGEEQGDSSSLEEHSKRKAYTTFPFCLWFLFPYVFPVLLNSFSSVCFFCSARRDATSPGDRGSRRERGNSLP